MSATPPIPYATEKPWTNWGGNQTCTPAYTVRSRDEQEALDVVWFAVREGPAVRAVGIDHILTRDRGSAEADRVLRDRVVAAP